VFEIQPDHERKCLKRKAYLEIKIASVQHATMSRKHCRNRWKKSRPFLPNMQPTKKLNVHLGVQISEGHLGNCYILWYVFVCFGSTPSCVVFLLYPFVAGSQGGVVPRRTVHRGTTTNERLRASTCHILSVYMVRRRLPARNQKDPACVSHTCMGCCTT
jgi:hypothetical protein